MKATKCAGHCLAQPRKDIEAKERKDDGYQDEAHAYTEESPRTLLVSQVAQRYSHKGIASDNEHEAYQEIALPSYV